MNELNNDENRKLQEAIDAVDEYGSITEAANVLGVPRRTLSGRYNKALDMGYKPGQPVLTPEQRIAVDSIAKNAIQDKRELQRKYNALLKKVEQQDQAFEQFKLFNDRIAKTENKPIKIVQNYKTSSESTAFILFSDLHYEETVDPRSIDGLNEYNTNIAQSRSEKVFQNAMKLVEMCRGRSSINKAVLWLGGDFINGFIHEEFMETNSMSPVESSIEIYHLLISAIDFLLEHGQFKQLVVVANVGNHGRTTKERRVSTNVENSFEWLIYNFLASHYADNDSVQFKLSRSYFNYLDVYGYRLRFHHGENVRYYGGVNGVVVPLNKCIAAWNQSRQADIDILGHYHQRCSGKNFVMNGSVIGYNAYALSIKAPYEPPQQSFFLMHPKHGKSVEAPIWVE